MTVTGYRIDSKIARKVFNGDFECLPLELVNMQITLNIRKEELQENYSRSEYIKKSDFKGLAKIEIIVKKIENIEGNEHLFSSFIMEKCYLNNKWYIKGKQYCNSYMKSGTRMTFDIDTADEINDRYYSEED